MIDPDSFDWSQDDKQEIKQVLKVTYETLKSIVSDYKYMAHCWADQSQPKALREREYKNTQAVMRNKMTSLSKTLKIYLKWISPEDEEEARTKNRGTRTQKGLIE